VVGKYPPFETGYFPVNFEDSRLILNIYYEKISGKEVFAPVPKLRKGSKLTDFMPGPGSREILSSRLKQIILGTKPLGMEFLPQRIIKDNIELSDFWLTNNFAFDFGVIDFAKTEISIMKSVWDEDYRIQTKNSEEFVQLVEQIKLPQNVKIFRPYFLENYEKDFFALRYVYNGFSFFCSQRFREKLEAEKITGIRFMELDEIL
jgi:hypothetical protein